MLARERQAGGLFVTGKGCERRHGIDAARGEEDHPRAVATGQLQRVVGTHEVRLDRIAGRPVDSREHRRLGRALDQRVDRIEGHQVVQLADVAVYELDTRFA